MVRGEVVDAVDEDREGDILENREQRADPRLDRRQPGGPLGDWSRRPRRDRSSAPARSRVASPRSGVPAATTSGSTSRSRIGSLRKRWRVSGMIGSSTPSGRSSARCRTPAATTTCVLVSRRPPASLACQPCPAAREAVDLLDHDLPPEPQHRRRESLDYRLGLVEVAVLGAERRPGDAVDAQAGDQSSAAASGESRRDGTPTRSAARRSPPSAASAASLSATKR